MPNWFIRDARCAKRGPTSGARPKTLTESGKISRKTVSETDMRKGPDKPNVFAS